MLSIQRCLRRVGTLGALGLLAGGLMTVGVFGSNAEEVSCFGKAATIVGTEGPEFIPGTSGDDVMVGLGGDDTLQGQEGSDALCGGDGDDALYGEGGTDSLDGGAGKDDCSYVNGDSVKEGDETYEGCEIEKQPRPAKDPSQDEGGGLPLPLP